MLDWGLLAEWADRQYWRRLAILSEAAIIKYQGSKKQKALNSIEPEFERRLTKWLADLQIRVVRIARDPNKDYEEMFRAMGEEIRSSEPSLYKIVSWGVDQGFSRGWADGLISLPKTNTEARLVEFSNQPLVSPAQQWINGHSAKLVSNISDDLRHDLRTTLTVGKAKGLSYQKLAKEIQALDPTFGPKRAKRIAVTELAFAYEQGNAEGPRSLKALGIDMLKTWVGLSDEKLCPTCADNLGDDIDIDDTFQSGHVLPPAHPNCRCTVTYERAPGPAAMGAEDFDYDPATGNWIPKTPKPAYDYGPQDPMDSVSLARPPSEFQYPSKYEGITSPDEAFKAMADLLADKLNDDGRPGGVEAMLKENVGAELAIPMLKAFEQMKMLYPGAWDGMLQAVEFIDFSKSDHNNAWAHVDGLGAFMRFNTAYFGPGNTDKLFASLTRSSDSGWHPDGMTNPGHIVTHEFGHVFDYWSSKMGQFTDHDPSDPTGPMRPGDAVSDYGATDSVENFAEAFAQIHWQPEAKWDGWTKQVSEYLISQADYTRTINLNITPDTFAPAATGPDPDTEPVLKLDTTKGFPGDNIPDPDDPAYHYVGRNDMFFENDPDYHNWIDQVNQDLKVQQAFEGYTQSDYAAYNGFLTLQAEGIDPMDITVDMLERRFPKTVTPGYFDDGQFERIKRNVDKMHAMLQSYGLPADVLLYRGGELPPNTPIMQPGTTIDRPAFTSTTTDQLKAYGFALGADKGIPTVWKIQADKGTPGGWMPEISSSPDEFEFLLPPGTKWEVVQDRVFDIPDVYNDMLTQEGREVTVRIVPDDQQVKIVTVLDKDGNEVQLATHASGPDPRVTDETLFKNLTPQFPGMWDGIQDMFGGNEDYTLWVDALSSKSKDAVSRYTRGDYTIMGRLQAAMSEGYTFDEITPELIIKRERDAGNTELADEWTQTYKTDFSHIKDPTNRKSWEKDQAFVWKKLKEDTQLFNDAVSKSYLPENVILWRGAGGEMFPNQLQPGAEVDRPSFTSTTFDSSTAVNFTYGKNDAIIWKILAPAGTPGAYVGEVGDVPEEQEFVLPAGSKWRVVEDKPRTTMGSPRQITVELIVPPGTAIPPPENTAPTKPPPGAHRKAKSFDDGELHDIVIPANAEWVPGKSTHVPSVKQGSWYWVPDQKAWINMDPDTPPLTPTIGSSWKAPGPTGDWLEWLPGLWIQQPPGWKWEKTKWVKDYKAQPKPDPEPEPDKQSYGHSDDGWSSPTSVAKDLGIKPQAIYAMIKGGHITFIGNNPKLVNIGDVQAYLAKKESAVTIGAAPICYSCIHKSKDLSCTAFPDGIPTPILYNEVDHRNPYKGDGGVRFEQNETKPVPSDVFAIWEDNDK